MKHATLVFLLVLAGCAKPQLGAAVPTPEPAQACDVQSLGELVPIPGAKEPYDQADLRLCVKTKTGKFFWISPGTKITDDGVEL